MGPYKFHLSKRAKCKYQTFLANSDKKAVAF